MASYLPTNKEQKRESLLLNDPHWRAEAPVLRSLLEDLRAATGDAALLTCQARLLARMKARQDVIGEQRAERARLKACLREAVRDDPKPIASIRDLQAQIKELDSAEFAQLACNHLLRSLGDALTWKRFAANRGAIAVLGQAQPVAWLSSGVGWTSELQAVQQVWEQDGVLAIVHDATTCLRLGDITCCFADRYEVREVKASKVADPTSIQMRRLNGATELITSGRATIDGADYAVLRAPVTYRTHLDDLDGVLALAKREGRAVARLSSAHLVVAHDLRLPAAVELPQFDHQQARKAAGWAEQDILINFGTSIRRMRDRHDNFPFLAPLSLLPLSSEDVADLMIGALDYTTWLNVSAVARYLGGRGWTVIPHPMPAGSDVFLTVAERSGRSPTSVRVVPVLREMMSLELMTTPTLADFVAHMFDALRADASLLNVRAMVVATEETGAWNL